MSLANMQLWQFSWPYDLWPFDLCMLSDCYRVCVPSLMLIVQAVFLLEHGQNRQMRLNERPTHAGGYAAAVCRPSSLSGRNVPWLRRKLPPGESQWVCWWDRQTDRQKDVCQTITLPFLLDAASKITRKTTPMFLVPSSRHNDFKSSTCSSNSMPGRCQLLHQVYWKPILIFTIHSMAEG